MHATPTTPLDGTFASVERERSLAKEDTKRHSYVNGKMVKESRKVCLQLRLDHAASGGQSSRAGGAHFGGNEIKCHHSELGTCINSSVRGSSSKGTNDE